MDAAVRDAPLLSAARSPVLRASLARTHAARRCKSVELPRGHRKNIVSSEAPMRRTCLVFVSCGLLAAVVVAQAPAPTADPISGRWVTDGRTLLELSLEGGAVTGTVFIYPGRPTPFTAPITTGTFDSGTGSLKLDGTATPPGG